MEADNYTTTAGVICPMINDMMLVLNGNSDNDSD
jgi:hypothetical protein